jgi:DNA relaxase NicK
MTEGELISAGIDYLTATLNRDAQLSAEWYGSCLNLSKAIADEGNDHKHARWQGYEGYRCGSSFVGEREDGYICQISGARAQTGFDNAYRTDVHFSRLDVQCSFRTLAKNAFVARSVQSDVARANRHLSAARQRKAQLTEDLQGGATCYVGSRKSAQYARIYNKEAESGEEQYKNVWRYELELHNVIATKTAEQFVLSSYEQSEHSAILVRAWLMKRRVRTPWKAEDALFALASDVPEPSDTDSRLKWLSEQVRPTVQRLIKLGLRDRMLVALGLDEQATDSV